MVRDGLPPAGVPRERGDWHAGPMTDETHDHADHGQPSPEHRRPDGVDDATVEALGKLSA
eukprot:gene7083-8497_t